MNKVNFAYFMEEYLNERKGSWVADAPEYPNGPSTIFFEPDDGVPEAPGGKGPVPKAPGNWGKKVPKAPPIHTVKRK